MAGDAFDPVSANRRFYFAGYANGESGFLAGFGPVHDQPGPRITDPPPLPEEEVEPGLSFEHCAAKIMGAQRVLLPVLRIGNGKAIPSLLSSAGKNLPAVFGGHPGAKTVGPGSFDLAGLIRTFHQTIPEDSLIRIPMGSGSGMIAFFPPTTESIVFLLLIPFFPLLSRGPASSGYFPAAPSGFKRHSFFPCPFFCKNDIETWPQEVLLLRSG